MSLNTQNMCLKDNHPSGIRLPSKTLTSWIPCSSVKPQVTVKCHSFGCSKNDTKLDEINVHPGWFLSAISLSLLFLSVRLLRF